METILQPKYVADFQCDGSKCNSKCCRDSWVKDIDMETYKKYQRIKNPDVRRKILSSIKPIISQVGFEFTDSRERSCPLLCDDNLCYIQKNMGVGALSKTCQVYPRNVIHIGDYQFRTLSMTCPVAAEAALFSDNAMELQQVAGIEDTEAWQLRVKDAALKSVDNDLLAVYIVMGGLSILQNTAYSFEQRLVLLGLFLDRVEDSQQDVGAVAELIDYYSSDAFQQEKKIASIVPLMPLLTDDYDKLYQDKHNAIQEHMGKVLERYWHHEWLYHAFPYAFDGSLMHNYFAYLITFEICKMTIYSDYKFDKPWNEKDILDTLASLSLFFDHEKDIVEALVKETAYFEQEPLKLMQVLLRIK